VGSVENYTQALMLTQDAVSTDSFTLFMDNSFGPEIWGELRGCVLSSVVPQKNEIIAQSLSKKNSALPPISHIDLTKSSVDFSQYNGLLGNDRAISCVAAAAKHKAPVIVIDLGTATTINAVDASNVFLGGAITAGVQTGLTALNSLTAQLPAVDDFTKVSLIGNDTPSCLVSGAVIGTACMLEGYVSRIKKEISGNPTVVITGGNAPKVMPFCNFGFIYEPSLLLEGMFLLS